MTIEIADSNHCVERVALGRCFGLYLLVLWSAMAAVPDIAMGQFSIVEQEDRVDVLRQGELVTSYQFRSGSKPVLWPIHGPDHQKMTRSYPLDATIPGEDHDHPHHRGLWMTFGEVNDMDWWAEGPGKGMVEHLRIVEAKATQDAATLTAEQAWMPPAPQAESTPRTLPSAPPVLHATCRYEIRGNDETRTIDCESLLRAADAEATVHFGDTKEGMFAIRVPEPMRGDRPEGTLRNNLGDVGGDVWGKSAKWVDYSGPVVAGESKIYGIAILVHPSSFRSDGLWHARTYGLFAHNPFGIKDFLPNRTQTASGKAPPPHAGGYLLPKGESLHFFYRVIFHRDRWTQEIGDRHWEDFAKSPTVLH